MIKTILKIIAIFILSIVLLFFIVVINLIPKENFKIIYKVKVPNLKEIWINESFDGEPYGATTINDQDGVISTDKEYSMIYSNDPISHLDRYDISTFEIQAELFDYADENGLYHYRASSNILNIPAEYGKKYTVIVEGDPNTNLQIRLE